MWTGPVIIAPLWQGSSVAKAAEASVGAEAVAVALVGPEGAAAAIRVPAPADLDRGAEACMAMYDALSTVLAGVPDTDPVLLVGGDCSVDRASLERSLRNDDVWVVWMDAHADANTIESSPSGAPHGMVVRDVLGDAPTRLVYVGTRAMDPEESRWIADGDVPVLPPTAAPRAVLAALPDTARVHLHIDVDVMDPAAFSGMSFAEPAGMSPRGLVEIVRMLHATDRLFSMTVAEHVPGPRADEDNAVLAQIGDALLS